MFDLCDLSNYDPLEESPPNYGHCFAFVQQKPLLPFLGLQFPVPQHASFAFVHASAHCVGAPVGFTVGTLEGETVTGFTVGTLEGELVTGFTVGCLEGADEIEGSIDGWKLGAEDTEGFIDG